jgi:tRNA(Arg) A34 adenosine deaminase TadA
MGCNHATVVRRSNQSLISLISLLCILFGFFSLKGDACAHQSASEVSMGSDKFNSPQVGLNRHEAADQAWKYLSVNLKRSSKEAELPQVRLMSQESANDIFWMKAALAAAMNCYGACPPLPYGSVLVNKTSSQEIMRSCNTVYIDGTNHAELNTLQLAAHYYPGRSPKWWSALTLYTTAEPCAMCMAAARWVGIGEIVYGTSIDTQSSLGWGSIHISASSINAESYELPSRTLLQGPFAASLTDPYFSWQFNQSAPCPPNCFRSPYDHSRCLAP